jgi:hypothetical protein
MGNTLPIAVATATATGIAIAVAVFASGSDAPGTSAGSDISASPLSSDLLSPIVQPGASVTTGVTLPPGFAAAVVVPKGPAAGSFVIDSITHTLTQDNPPLVWLEVTAHNTGSSPVRFVADFGYGSAAAVQSLQLVPPVDAGLSLGDAGSVQVGP